MKTFVVVFAVLVTVSLSFSQSTPSISPIRDFKGNTVEFGPKIHPILHVNRAHNGMDFIVPQGTAILATADGIVKEARTVEDYGIVVRIQHAKGIQTFYAHLSSLAVKKGAHVSQGQVIAYSGNTGLSSQPHLHYEVIEAGVRVNPRDFLANK